MRLYRLVADELRRCLSRKELRKAGTLTPTSRGSSTAVRGDEDVWEMTMSGCCSTVSRNNSNGGPDEPRSAARGQAGEVTAINGGETFVGTHEPILALDGEGPELKVTVKDFFL